jgi:hypothetical protein
MEKLLSIAIVTLMLSVSAATQTRLAGTWQGETNAGASVQLDLIVKGTNLTGTLTRNGQSTPLSDGKVSKDSFTFKARLNEQVEGFTGERAGDELKVWLDRQGRATAIVLKRVKRATPNR